MDDTVMGSGDAKAAVVDDDVGRRAAEELRLLYSCSVSEIAAFKHQQWQATNYAMLMYAAIAGLPKLVEPPLLVVETFFVYVAIAAVCLAVWHQVGVLSDSIQLRRERLREARSMMTVEFLRAWRGGKGADDVADISSLKADWVWFFRAALAAGAFGACWLAGRHV